MSWMMNLYKTYENIEKLENRGTQNILWPVSHFVKNAHLEIVIDNAGNFLKGRTQILNGKQSPTLIPATEASAGRAGAKIAPHPLCDEIGYCAIDRPKANVKKVSAYIKQLRSWAVSEWTHPKVEAILNYLEKKTLWKDLSDEIDFPVKIKKITGKNEKIKDEKVFIRWRIEEPGQLETTTWQDNKLIQSWIEFDHQTNSKNGYCYICGDEGRRASNHPRFLRWPGDGAKLLSSNDHSGFTFRGRFTDSKITIEQNGMQAVSVSFDVTQKAHNALRWLISRQGFRNNEQVYICWAVSGKKTPDPLRPTFDFFQTELQLQEEQEQEQQPAVDHSVNLGASFAVKLKKYLVGYSANLEPNEQIIVMGMDSATPGRMGIIYYRQLLASEFLQRLETWHYEFAWPQRHTIEIPGPAGKKKAVKKTIWTVSCPAPRMIAEAAYGNILKSNETLKKSVIERILPCIIDGRPFPHDIVESAVRRAGNRQTKRLSEQYSNVESEKGAWEKHLGVVCALYKGYYLRHPMENERRKYIMALEEDRTTRDYLYGRLLAIAERIEEMAMIVADEKPRTTVASRLMQRFSDNPFSTWLNIEKGIVPYQERLKNNIAPLAEGYKRLIDDACDAFKIEDFKSKEHLSGEYLLGYHSQRKWFREHKLDKGKWILKTQDNNKLDITKGEQS